MATHSSTLAWGIPRTEDLAGYSLWDRKESDTTVRLTCSFICFGCNSSPGYDVQVSSAVWVAFLIIFTVS